MDDGERKSRLGKGRVAMGGASKENSDSNILLLFFAPAELRKFWAVRA